MARLTWFHSMCISWTLGPALHLVFVSTSLYPRKRQKESSPQPSALCQLWFTSLLWLQLDVPRHGQTIPEVAVGRAKWLEWRTGAGYEVGRAIQKRQMAREVCENGDKQAWLEVENKNVKKRSPQTSVAHLKKVSMGGSWTPLSSDCH